MADQVSAGDRERIEAQRIIDEWLAESIDGETGQLSQESNASLARRIADLLASQAAIRAQHGPGGEEILRAVTGSADTNDLLPQRPEGVVSATAPERVEAAVLDVIDAALLRASAPHSKRKTLLGIRERIQIAFRQEADEVSYLRVRLAEAQEALGHPVRDACDDINHRGYPPHRCFVQK